MRGTRNEVRVAIKAGIRRPMRPRGDFEDIGGMLDMDIWLARARRHPFVTALLVVGVLNLIRSTYVLRPWTAWPSWSLLGEWLGWTSLILLIFILFVGTFWLLSVWVRVVDEWARAARNRQRTAVVELHRLRLQEERLERLIQAERLQGTASPPPKVASAHVTAAEWDLPTPEAWQARTAALEHVPVAPLPGLARATFSRTWRSRRAQRSESVATGSTGIQAEASALIQTTSVAVGPLGSDPGHPKVSLLKRSPGAAVELNPADSSDSRSTSAPGSAAETFADASLAPARPAQASSTDLRSRLTSTETVHASSATVATQYVALESSQTVVAIPALNVEVLRLLSPPIIRLQADVTSTLPDGPSAVAALNRVLQRDAPSLVDPPPLAPLLVPRRLVRWFFGEGPPCIPPNHVVEQRKSPR